MGGCRAVAIIDSSKILHGFGGNPVFQIGGRLKFNIDFIGSNLKDQGQSKKKNVLWTLIKTYENRRGQFYFGWIGSGSELKDLIAAISIKISSQVDDVVKIHPFGEGNLVGLQRVARKGKTGAPIKCLTASANLSEVLTDSITITTCFSRVVKASSSTFICSPVKLTLNHF